MRMGVMLVHEVRDELAHLGGAGGTIWRCLPPEAKTSNSGIMHVGGSTPATANAVL